MLYTKSQGTLLLDSDIKKIKFYIIYGCGGNLDHLNKLSSEWNHLGDFCTGLYEKALCELFFIWTSGSGGDAIYTYFVSTTMAIILFR